MANIKNLQTLKYHVFSTKNIISSYYHEDEKIFKEEESIEILKSKPWLNYSNRKVPKECIIILKTKWHKSKI